MHLRLHLLLLLSWKSHGAAPLETRYPCSGGVLCLRSSCNRAVVGSWTRKMNVVSREEAGSGVNSSGPLRATKAKRAVLEAYPGLSHRAHMDMSHGTRNVTSCRTGACM